MKRIRSIAGLAVVAWCLAAVAAADAAVVKEVQVENRGDGTVDKGFVLGHIRTRVGGKFESSLVARDVRALLKTGVFSAVDSFADERADGVIVTFSVRNKVTVLDPVAVFGAHAMSVAKVRDLLGIAVGDRVDDAALAAAARRVRKEYENRHYRRAAVDWKIDVVDHQAGQCRVSVTIREGERGVVRKVEFVGNQVMSESVLRHKAELPIWWNPFTWGHYDRYDEDDFQAIRLAVQEWYKNNGYLDCTVGDGGVTLLRPGALRVDFPITEGTRYLIGTVSFTGATLFAEAELRKGLPLHGGDIASSSNIQAAAQTVRDHYGSHGYIRTTVEPSLSPRADKPIVDLQFIIREGGKIAIRNVEIVGNYKTRDKVIRRELLVFPGDIYDMVRVKRSERRLRNLGYFSDVQMDDSPTSEPGKSDLLVTVEEKSTGQFLAGMGFSDIEKVFGYVEIGQSNFDIFGWPTLTGAGQRVRARAQWGSVNESYLLQFEEPWFLDHRLTLDMDLHALKSSYSGYDTSRKGGSIGVTKPLPGPNRVTLQYTLEQVSVSDVTDTNEYFDADGQPFSFATHENNMESTMRATLSHDTRDNPFTPQSGSHATLMGRLTGGPLGFDTDLYGGEVRWAYYQPLWFRHVLSFDARADVIDAYGKTDTVPLPDKLFCGGSTTVRGFKYMDVGPKATRTITAADGSTTTAYKPMGGQTLAVASAEYTIPLVQYLRLAGFYDAGNAWEDPFQVDTGKLATSAGLGIRIGIPGFPIRLDYAWPLQRDDDLTQERRFSFSIDADF